MEDKQVSPPDPRDKPAVPLAIENGADEDRRLQRIFDYTSDSLSKSDPFAANLGAVNSDLLLIAYRLRQALDEALQPGPTAFDELDHMHPALDQYLKVTKQVDRFSQLAIKLDDSQAKATRVATITPASDSCGPPNEQRES